MDQRGSLRRAATPVDHLMAEMAAVPIASPVSLGLAITELEPWLPNRMADIRSPGRPSPTAELWRQTEGQLLQAFPAVSLDELVAIRDMLWFQRGAGESPTIGAYLEELASLFLENRGSSLTPTLPPDHVGRTSQPPTPAEKRRALRWLTLAIPPDLLCAAAARGDDARELALTNSTVDRMLRSGGFAETHLHLGAALSFDTIWHALVASVGRLDFDADALSSPGAELDEGRDLGPWLIRAAIGRLLLARYLRDRTLGPGRGTADRRRWIPDDRGIDFDAYAEDPDVWRRIAPATTGAHPFTARQVLDDLRWGSLDPNLPFARAKELYRRMVGCSPTDPAQCIEDVASLDPLSSIFLVTPGRPDGRMAARSTRTPEQRFVGSAMKYVEANEEDRSFATIFWQVVRVRCLIYRHLVQRPLTPGLQWFVRFYGRIGPAKARLGWPALLDAAAELDGLGRGLMSLEVRRSPFATLSQNMDFIGSTAEWASRDSNAHGDEPPEAEFLRHGLTAFIQPDEPAGPVEVPPLEVGAVLHFTKDRGGGARVGLPSGHWAGSHADPTPDQLRGIGPGGYREELLDNSRRAMNASGFRYAAFYTAKRAEAVSLARVFQRWPRSLLIVRGLDVCTDELGVPSWVIQPLLERVRSAAALGATALDRLGEGPAPPLHTTVHAGEDFVHLATGLRGVDEAIEHLGLAEGDRIGHAIALGVDATTWAERIGRVAISREVRMWDLQWEWSWNAAGGGGSVPRHSFIERELSRLTEDIFGHIIQPYELELLSKDLLDSTLLWRVGWPHGAPPGEQADFARLPIEAAPGTLDRRLALLYRYLSDPLVFDLGRRVEWIDPSPEAEALEYLQHGLREKVASYGLTVEVNPTSNLLIGDLGSLTQHPMWRLDPPRPDPAMPPVAICVGSDDPLTFASSLVEEYNVLYDGLMEAGLEDASAREWLERVRRRGLEARFTCDPSRIRPLVELPNPLRDYPSQVL